MPKDTSNTNHATAMVATLALEKAVGAIRSIPGMSPRYKWSVAEYDGPERISQVLSTLRDRRNLERFGAFRRSLFFLLRLRFADSLCE